MGFCQMGITRPYSFGTMSARLEEFLQNQYHGTMTWMEERQNWRSNPKELWPEVRSIIMLAMNYGPDTNPLENLAKKDKASISVYARNRDYHDLVKGRLKQMAGRLVAKAGGNVKVFVDTAPVMEKPLAHQAGLGWQGKHTNLVNRDNGSWLFLGAIFTTLELPYDEKEVDHCGSCQACLDVCPTKAFPEPYKLDARRCISYLTIEHKGIIDKELRPLMGNRIYGCDDCLAVCPWNKFAKEAQEVNLMARNDLRSPDLTFLLTLDDKTFREFFSGSPIKRIGRNKFVSNVLIAIGNSGDEKFIPMVEGCLRDEAEIVRAMAIWALKKLLQEDAFYQIKKCYVPHEKSASVLNEWME